MGLLGTVLDFPNVNIVQQTITLPEEPMQFFQTQMTSPMYSSNITHGP